MTRFIVGEVSRNWRRDGDASNKLLPLVDGPLLCEMFEHMIEVNLQRGYLLHSFQLRQIAMTPDELLETIIAVFQQDEDY